MDSYHEAHLMRILEKRRRRGVLGVYDDSPTRSGGALSQPPPHQQQHPRSHSAVATQTAGPFAEASTSPPPSSRGAQTSTPLYAYQTQTYSSAANPATATRKGRNADADADWRDGSRLGRSVRPSPSSRAGGAAAAAYADHRGAYNPTTPSYAAVRYRSPSRVPSLMYSPTRGPSTTSPPRLGSAPLWGGDAPPPPLPPPSDRVPRQRLIPSPLRYSPSRGRSAHPIHDARADVHGRGGSPWRRDSLNRSQLAPSSDAPRRWEPHSSSLLFRGTTLTAAAAAPTTYHSRRRGWLDDSAYAAQPVARWRSPSQRTRHPYDNTREDRESRQPQLQQLHHHRDHRGSPRREKHGKHRSSEGRGRSGSRHRSAAAKKEHRKKRAEVEERRRRRKERARRKKEERGSHRVDPRLALAPLDGGLDSDDSASNSSGGSSCGSYSASSSSSSSSSAGDRDHYRKEKKGHKKQTQKRKGVKQRAGANREGLSMMPFPAAAARAEGGRPAGCVIPLSASTGYGSMSGGRQQSGAASGPFSATRTNASQSMHVNPNEQVGLPDVRSTIDLKTSTQVLHSGEWFYKWNRSGTEVHPRWVWVDLKSYLLVWSHRETRDPTFSGSVKLENICQIAPSELVQADEEGLPKTYYVLMIETTTRVLQLATERKNKIDLWFEALNNVIAFVRQRDIAKGTQIPD